MNSDKVLQYILDLPHYPTWDEICNHFEDLENPSIEDILEDLISECKIIVDDDNEIIVTAVTNEKLREMMSKSVRLV